MNDKLNRPLRQKTAHAKTKNHTKPINASNIADNKSSHLVFNEENVKSNLNENHNQFSSEVTCFLLGEDGSKTEWNGGWIPTHSSVEFAGRKLPDMIYVGKPPEKENIPWLNRYPHHVYIDPNLEIFDAPHESRAQFSSKARTYDKISPSDRGHYLNWLQDGKADQEYDPRYMMMYVMGLEYRYFIDDRDQLYPNETTKLLYEIDDLLVFHPHNPIEENLLQFRQFIFLEIVQSQFFHHGEIKNYGNAESYFKILGGMRAGNGLPLDSSIVLHFLRMSLTKEIDEVYNTCLYVFEQQFMAKFDQEYPNGLHISIPEKLLFKSYTALYDDFEFNEPIMLDGKKIPDISDSDEIKNVAISIGTAIAKELAPYCHELKQNALHINTTKEIEFLTDMGANSTKSNADELLKQWVTEQIEKDNITFRKIASLFIDSTFKNWTEIVLDEKQWYQTLAALNRIGYGVVPDLFVTAADLATDEEITLIKYKSEYDDRTKSSGNYLTELLSLAIGEKLISPKWILTKDEIAILTQRLNNAKGLTKSEIERLEAYLERLPWYGFHTNIFQLMRSLPNDIDKTVIRDSIKFYTENDDTIIFECLALIVEIYEALDIDVSLIESDLKLIGEDKEMYLCLIDESDD